ncbi:FtsX-like permease family protein [Streptomyces sp. NPDC048521]|uniref:FtsX-like permease family protein n=1 Tax=Streptomyces sp. NPDC048521 TaxID=3365566 RepID=UPI003717E513
MLSLALRTLRARRSAFVGSFVALALGTALLTVMGLALAASLDAPDREPERFAAAPVVVKGADTLRVPTATGDRVRALARPRPLPAYVVEKLRTLGTVVEDRSFPVRADGGPADLVGHPWSTAPFARYALDAGRAPRRADEVVVTGDWARPGTRLGTDRGPVRVVGTVPARGFEHAVFYTDTRAARLAPVSTQLATDADPRSVTEVVRGTGAQVLTGDERCRAEPGPDRDREALTALNALFGTAGGVAAFVSAFVVASTFAFAVAQRRREFGLLRAAGATPGQVRRLVTAEALLVGALASAAGCALGGYLAQHLIARVVAEGLAPRWFRLGDHGRPYHLAFWTGLLVALCGVLAASRQAGRIGPLQALREADVDARATTWGRRLAGGALLLTAAVTLASALAGDPGELLHRKSYVSRPMLVTGAVALLAPALVRPLVRALVRLPGATGLLVRESAAGAVRRTAAIAAPVLVTVALAAALPGTTATLQAARAAEARARTAAAFVVSPPAGAGFDTATLRRLRAVPGAEVSATASDEVYVLEDGVALIRSQARAADPVGLAATTRLPLTAGDVRALDDDSIIVNEEWRRHTSGSRVTVWLGDGTRRTLRIAAVMATGTGDNGVYVTPRNAPGAPVDRVDVAVAEDADPAAVAAGLRAAVREAHGRVRTGQQWVEAGHPANDRTTRLGLLLVLGIALVYTGICVINTMVMAHRDRLRDLVVLRSTGATRGQLLRLVALDALTVVAVGTVLGLLTAALHLAGIAAALHLLSAPAVVRVPWSVIGATVGVCALLAVTAATVPAAFALRRHSA